MTTVSILNEQIINGPILYKNGMLPSNDATTPNTIIDIASGACRDSTGSFDINVGNYLGQFNSNVAANVVTKINAAVNGANGLDTGSLGASSCYYIYAISDVSDNPLRPGACIISLAAPATGPLMPYGYGAQRCIGAIFTDGSSHFLPTYYSGIGGTLFAQYDAPQTVTVTASGTSATYSAMDLSVAVPSSNFGLVGIQMKWTCNAAADTAKFTPTGGTGDAFTFLGQVASVALENSFLILPLLATAKPEISYKVSAGTLNTVQVQSFQMLL